MNDSSTSRRRYRVQVLDRAARILQVLAEAGTELGPAEIAGRLAFHKSTIHRLLVVLEHHRFIRRRSGSGGKYVLGLRLFELGHCAVASVHVREEAEPFLARLVVETGETAHVCVPDDGQMVSVANLESRYTVRTPATVGRRTPVHCTSVGKAYLAFQSRRSVDDILSHQPLRAYTAHTRVTRAAVIADLEQVRARGYALDDEEIEKGLRCIGAPVRNYSGEVVASIAIAGPAFRVTRNRIPALARSVMAAGRDLSAALGYRPGDDRGQQKAPEAATARRTATR